MDELTERLAKRAGIDPAVALNAGGGIVDSRCHQRSPQRCHARVKGHPASNAAFETASSDRRITSLTGRGLMELWTRSTGCGVGTDQFLNSARRFLEYGGARIRPDRMNAILARAPVLAVFA